MPSISEWWAPQPAAAAPQIVQRLTTRLPSRFKFPAPHVYIAVGAATLGSLILLRSISSSPKKVRRKPTPSPKDNIVNLSPIEAKGLPYPPNALPGARDVDSPYGSTRVYEWGPEKGERVLLIHGISTPSIVFTDLAHKLVGKGCRVMLFDLFGRGYSSAPSPEQYDYDSSLYMTQILLCLQSSRLSWAPFTIIGYSLGGALAADFASYFPNQIKGLVLVAPGGLMRTSHITWGSKLLYQSGWLPEWFVEWIVAKKLWTGPDATGTVELDPEALENAETSSMRVETSSIRSSKGGRKRRSSSSSFISSNESLLPSNSQSGVSAVVDWQIEHHPGFVRSFISSIRYAPIHEQQQRWGIIRENIERKRGSLRRVRLVLGELDPLVIADELTEDADEVLGKDNVKVKLIRGAGHELAVEHADEIVDVVGSVLGFGRRGR